MGFSILSGSFSPQTLVQRVIQNNSIGRETTFSTAFKRGALNLYEYTALNIPIHSARDDFINYKHRSQYRLHRARALGFQIHNSKTLTSETHRLASIVSVLLFEYFVFVLRHLNFVRGAGEKCPLSERLERARATV